jgi:hypothetical protein
MSSVLRWTTAALDLLVAAAVACAPLTATAIDRRAVGPSVALSLIGVGVLTAGLAGLASAIGSGTLFLGAGYGLSLIGRGGAFDSGVLFVAPALLLVSELAYWSLDARIAGAGTDWTRRLGMVAAMAGAGLVAAAAIQATVSLPSVRGIALTAAGVAAAVGVLLIADRLARRSAADPVGSR